MAPVMCRQALAASGLCLALALAGCSGDEAPEQATTTPTATSSPSSSPASSPSEATVDGHRGRYSGPLTEVVRRDPPGLLLEPPPADADPDASWTEALAGCFHGAIACVANGNAELTLALVTGPGDAVIKGRTIFDRSLTYVVTWDPAPCSTIAAERCRVVNLLTADAKGALPAGTQIYAFELPADDDAA